MNLDATVSDVYGNRLARVADGHFQSEDPDSRVFQRAGHFRITHPLTADVMPGWALNQMRQQEPGFDSDGYVTMLEMEVLQPNLVRVQGLWIDDNGGFVITRLALDVVAPQAADEVGDVEGHGLSVLSWAAHVAGEAHRSTRTARARRFPWAAPAPSARRRSTATTPEL